MSSSQIKSDQFQDNLEQLQSYTLDQQFNYSLIQVRELYQKLGGIEKTQNELNLAINVCLIRDAIEYHLLCIKEEEQGDGQADQQDNPNNERPKNMLLSNLNSYVMSQSGNSHRNDSNQVYEPESSRSFGEICPPQFEAMLQKLESDKRSYVRMQHQYTIFIEELEEKITELKKEKLQ